MDLSFSLHSAAFLSVLFSTLTTIGIALIGPSRPQKTFKPAGVLPSLMSILLNTITKGGSLTTNSIPWTTQSRSRLVCKAGANCTPGGSAYSVTLPRLERPGSGVTEWDPIMNTWHISSQAYLRTGLPLVYPVATVVVVPKDTPKHVNFIVDTGIVPMVLADGSLLNMGSNWQTETSGLGLDVTGNNASSFVVSNLSDHDIFFAKTQVLNSNSEYWIISPSSKVLFWQEGPYWSVLPKRNWLAYSLPNVSDDIAAHIAETMMYDVLGQQNPVWFRPV